MKYLMFLLVALVFGLSCRPSVQSTDGTQLKQSQQEMIPELWLKDMTAEDIKADGTVPSNVIVTDLKTWIANKTNNAVALYAASATDYDRQILERVVGGGVHDALIKAELNLYYSDTNTFNASVALGNAPPKEGEAAVPGKPATVSAKSCSDFSDEIGSLRRQAETKYGTIANHRRLQADYNTAILRFETAKAVFSGQTRPLSRLEAEAETESTDGAAEVPAEAPTNPGEAPATGPSTSLTTINACMANCSCDFSDLVSYNSQLIEAKTAGNEACFTVYLPLMDTLVSSYKGQLTTIEPQITAVNEEIKFVNDTLKAKITMYDQQCTLATTDEDVQRSFISAGGGLTYDSSYWAITLDGQVVNPTGEKRRASTSSRTISTVRAEFRASMMQNVDWNLNAQAQVSLLQMLEKTPVFNILKKFALGNFADMFTASASFDAHSVRKSYTFNEFNPINMGLSEYEIWLLNDFLPTFCQSLVANRPDISAGFSCPYQKYDDADSVYEKIWDEHTATLRQVQGQGVGPNQPVSIAPVTVAANASPAAGVGGVESLSPQYGSVYEQLIATDARFLRIQGCDYDPTGSYWGRGIAKMFFAGPSSLKTEAASHQRHRWGDVSYMMYVKRKGFYGSEKWNWIGNKKVYDADIEEAPGKCQYTSTLNSTCYQVKYDLWMEEEKWICEQVVNKCLPLKQNALAISFSGLPSPEFDSGENCTW